MHIDRCAAGDLVALAKQNTEVGRRARARLLAQYEPLVRATVRRVRTPKPLCEDAAQAAREGCLTALRNHNSARGAFATLALPHAYGAAFRAAFPDGPVDKDAPPVGGTDDVETAADTDPAFDDALERATAAAARDVRAFLDSLPPARRGDLIAHVVNGEPKADIARRRGVSRAAVGQGLARAFAEGADVLAEHRPVT